MQEPMEDYKDELEASFRKLADKVVLDCYNICHMPGVYHI